MRFSIIERTTWMGCDKSLFSCIADLKDLVCWLGSGGGDDDLEASGLGFNCPKSVDFDLVRNNAL